MGETLYDIRKKRNVEKHSCSDRDEYFRTGIQQSLWSEWPSFPNSQKWSSSLSDPARIQTFLCLWKEPGELCDHLLYWWTCLWQRKRSSSAWSRRWKTDSPALSPADTDKIIADKRNFFGNHPSQCKIIRSAMPFCSGTENQEHSCRIDRIPMGTGNRQQFFCCRTIETGDW